MRSGIPSLRNDTYYKGDCQGAGGWHASEEQHALRKGAWNPQRIDRSLGMEERVITSAEPD